MIYWISPDRIRHTLENQITADLNGLEVDEDFDKICAPFDENIFYQSFKQVLNGKSWEETQYFKNYFIEIKRGRSKSGLGSVNDLIKHCQNLESIFNDIRTFGFRQVGDSDCICAAVGHDGRLVLIDGVKRLAFAKLSNIETIPVKISYRHSGWVEFLENVEEYQKNHQGKFFAPVDHPDFSHTQSHFMGQASCITGHMLPESKSVLDIDSLGFLPEIVSGQGKKCVALNDNPEILYFIKNIRKANSADYTVIERNISDYISSGCQFDTVFALNSFHKYLENENLRSAMSSTLKLIDMEEMFLLCPLRTAMDDGKSAEETCEKSVEFILNNSCLDSSTVITEFEGKKLIHLTRKKNVDDYLKMSDDFKILFLSFVNATYPQIFKKVNGQFKGLKKNHPNCHAVVIGWGKDDVKTSDYDFDFIDLRRFKNGESQKGPISLDIINKISPDIVYMRYPVGDANLEYLTRNYSKIIFEHQTFELEELQESNQNLFLNELAFGTTCMQRVLGGIGVTDEISGYEQRRVSKDKHFRTMGNGIDVSTHELSSSPSPKGKIHALLIANFQYWHGLDRLIAGCINNPEAAAKFKFHLVGYGPALDEGIKTIEANGISKSFVIHGKLEASQINPLADLCTIAIGGLSPHRVSLSQTSSLKLREYALRGLPLFFSGEDSDLKPHLEFCHIVAGNDDPIDITELLDFAEKCRKTPDLGLAARDFAISHLSWDAKMKTVKSLASHALAYDKFKNGNISEKRTGHINSLEQAITQNQAMANDPQLYADIIKYLKFEGESARLTKWIMDYHLSKGKVMPAGEGKPDVSFIVPCYNHSEYLTECVLSLLKQDYTSFEIIIINDGSTDNSKEVAEKLISEYPDHRIKCINQQNSGLVRSRNRGCTVAKGKYIVPIDADDLIAPTFLSKTVAVMESGPQLSYVSTKALFFGHSNLIWPRHELNPADFFIRNQQTCSTLFRKQMWKDLGGYDESMTRGYEDWELWIRATKNGMTGFQIDEPLFFYRRKENSMITSSREKDASIKKQIIHLHPDVYDAALLPSVGGEIHRSNWIPPELIRPEFKSTLKADAGLLQNQPETNCAENFDQKMDDIKKLILINVSTLLPEFKDQILSSQNNFGKEFKFKEIYKEVESGIAKLEKLEENAPSTDLSATLLSKYPLEKQAVVLFAKSLMSSFKLAAAFNLLYYYLSFWPDDSMLSQLTADCLCNQAGHSGSEATAMGLYEGAALFAPKSKSVRQELYNFQRKCGFKSAAENTGLKALKAGISLDGYEPAPESEKDNRKHIWYVSNAFSYAEGGINGVTQAKMMTLGALLSNNDKYKVTIITPLTQELPQGIAEFAAQHIPLMTNFNADWPDIVATVRRKPSGNSLLNGEWTPRNELSQKADLIIVEGIRMHPHNYLMELGLQFNCPKILMHHNSPYHYSAEITDAGTLPDIVNAIKKYECNVSVSQTVVEQWQNITELKNTNWVSILNCVRENEVEAVTKRSKKDVQKDLGLSAEDFNIICLASVQHRKGQDILLEHMPEIIKEIPNVKVTFIGPILANRGGNEIVAKGLGKSYSSKIQFLGAKRNALEYVYAGELLVLPSREEALPLSILEAMAVGRTAVASEVNGVPEIIKDGESGFMFAIDRPDIMVDHIVTLAGNPDLLEKFSEQAKRLYHEKFSRKQHTKRWAEVLNQILN